MYNYGTADPVPDARNNAIRIMTSLINIALYDTDKPGIMKFICSDT